MIPGFPATQDQTRTRARLVDKERRMKTANATKFHRKSGGGASAGERSARFQVPLNTLSRGEIPERIECSPCYYPERFRLIVPQAK